MKIRLHEIELGSGDVHRSSAFYQSLFGMQAKREQEGLTVLNTHVAGLDFNLSNFGMMAIRFTELNGYLTKVTIPREDSSSWLKV